MDTTTRLASGRTVGEILQASALEEEAAHVTREADSLEAGIRALMDADMHAEAVALLARALPDREAVGWAWVCARDAVADDAPEEQKASLDATRAWIREPGDAARRAAMDAGEAAGLDTPAGFVAFAAFCCGDSLAPADLPDAPPPPGLVGTVVSGCIALAASQGDPEGIGERFASCAERGMDLASRIELWTPPDAASPPSS